MYGQMQHPIQGDVGQVVGGVQGGQLASNNVTRSAEPTMLDVLQHHAQQLAQLQQTLAETQKETAYLRARLGI